MGVVLADVVDDREDKGEGFAASGLGEAEHVVVVKGKGKRL
jgi:hypothetical protein